MSEEVPVSEYRSLGEIDGELDSAELQVMYAQNREAELTRQLAALNKELAEIRESKNEARVRRVSLRKERDSTERYIELQEEQARIAAEFAREKEQLVAQIEGKSWATGDPSIKSWQIDGAAQLAAARRGLLADTRGMGKTLSSMAWATMVGANKLLVLTRKSYADEFIKELHYWDPTLTIIPMLDTDLEHRRTLANILRKHKEFVVVANFEMWRRSGDASIIDLLSIGFDAVILDEAHQMKNSKTSTAQGFLKIAQMIPDVLLMTGTPIQNRPQELFTLLHSLYPHLFPHEGQFRYDHCMLEKDDEGRDIPNKWTWRPGGKEALVRKMSKFFVAREPADVGHDVPPPDIKVYPLDLEGYDQQLEAYRFMAQRTMAKLTNGQVLPIRSQLALMTRLCQLTAWPAGIVFQDKDEEGNPVGPPIQFDVFESAKLDWAEMMIKDLVDEGERVVLFSRFVEPILELQRRLKGEMSVALVSGSTDAAYKREVTADFDLKTAPDNPKYQVLLTTYGTMGESVNLNAARHAILYDQFWKPSNDDQAIGRIDRMNSVLQAIVHMPRINSTIDMLMADIVDHKRKMIRQFKTAQEMQNEFIKNLEMSL